jgi:hypothetical protein
MAVVMAAQQRHSGNGRPPGKRAHFLGLRPLFDM